LFAHSFSSPENSRLITFLLFPFSDFLRAPKLPRLHPQRYRRSAAHRSLAELPIACSICLPLPNEGFVSFLRRLAADSVYCDFYSLLHSCPLPIYLLKTLSESRNAHEDHLSNINREPSMWTAPL